MSGLYTRLSENVGPFAVVYGIFLSMGEAGMLNLVWEAYTIALFR